MNKKIYRHNKKILSAFQEVQDRRSSLNVWLTELEKVKHQLAEYEKSIGFDGDVTELEESEMEKEHVGLYYKMLFKGVAVSQRASDLKEAILKFRMIRDNLYSSHIKETTLKIRQKYEH